MINIEPGYIILYINFKIIRIEGIFSMNPKVATVTNNIGEYDLIVLLLT